MLPFWDIPVAAVHDEFSYLLLGDTLAHGRLANPPHPMRQFFEVTHVLSTPTYASKYFPGQGVFLAFGQALLGHPWFGVLLSSALMAGATLWAAFAWLPPGWALLAGVLCFPMSAISYWMNSYWGGSVCGLGGALVLGAVGRMLDGTRGVYANSTLLGAGSVLICWTRPFEGILFLTPLFLFLLWKSHKTLPLTAWIPVTAVGLLGAAFLGFFFYRITGNAMVPPEAEFQRQYGRAPLFIFGEVGPLRQLRDPHMDLVHNRWEVELIERERTLDGLLERGAKNWGAVAQIAGGHWILLVPLLCLWPFIIRTKPGILCWLVLIIYAASAPEMYFMPHFSAPQFAAIIIVVAAGFQHLYSWKFQGKPAGRLLAPALAAVGLLLGLGGTAWDWMKTHESGDPMTYFTLPTGGRDRLEQSLAEGKHVVLVRYEPPYNFHAQWVFNKANIDLQSVVWAHDLGEQENRLLQAYYPDRKFWLYRPNQDPTWLTEYK